MTANTTKFFQISRYCTRSKSGTEPPQDFQRQRSRSLDGNLNKDELNSVEDINDFFAKLRTSSAKQKEKKKMAKRGSVDSNKDAIANATENKRLSLPNIENGRRRCNSALPELIVTYEE